MTLSPSTADDPTFQDDSIVAASETDPDGAAVDGGSLAPMGSGSGSGSGSGGEVHHIFLHQSGDSQGYTDYNPPTPVAYNQIGGAEEIAFTSDTESPVTSVSWTITGGAYSEINTSLPDHSGLNPLSLGSFTTTTIHSGEFYWNEKPGTKSVKAVATFLDGETATGTISVTVQAPTLVSMSRAYVGVTKSADVDGTVFFINAVLNPDGTETPGEIFTASISTASLDENLPGDNYYFTQLISPSQIYVTNDNSTVTRTGPSLTIPMLDNPVALSGSQVYGGWSTPSLIPAGRPELVTLPNDGSTIRDSPNRHNNQADPAAYAAGGIYTTQIVFNQSFKMYLMFQPKEGLQSAIGEVDWFFKFTAVFNSLQEGQHTTAYYSDPANWALSATTPSASGTANGSAVHLMPQWKGWYQDDLTTTIN